MPSSGILDSVVPRSIIIGKSILEKIPRVMDSLRLGPKTLILTGPKTQKIAGEPIFNHITNHGLDCELLIIENSFLETAETYRDIVKNYKPDLLISAGGGKVIDVGKYCVQNSEYKLEMISVPTSTPHDGIISPYIFLNNPSETLIGECSPPIAIIADIQVIQKNPHLIRYLAAGVGDTVGKITSTWDWKYAWRMKSEKYSRFVGGVLENADNIFQNTVNEALLNPETAIQTVLKALIIAGVLMGTSNSIRVGYGSEHMFSAALDAEYHGKNILHGERVALGTILISRLQSQNQAQIIEILKKAGCPTNIYELEDEIPPHIIVKALRTAHTISSMYTVLGRTGLTEMAAWNLVRGSGII